MNASKARRRWIKWCRYLAATGTQANRFAGLHNGQARAYQDLTFAGRAYPRGARYVYYPRWAVRRG